MVTLDNQLFSFSKKLTDDNIARYYDYFNLFYHGKSGMLKYCDDEFKSNNEILNSSLNNLKEFLIREDNKYKTSYKFIKHSGIDFPIFLEKYTVKSISKGEYHTGIIEKVGYKNSHIIGGVHATFDNKIQPYLMLVDSFTTVKWYATNFTVNKEGNNLDYLLPISVIPVDSNKTFVLTHSWNPLNDSVSAQNNVVEINNKGNIVRNILLDNSDFPCYFYYDDINKEFLLAYKGKTEDQNTDSFEVATFSLYDSLATKIWDFKFDLKGSLIDIVHTNNDFLVFCNFNQYKRNWDNNELIKLNNSSAAFNNVMSIYLNHSGQVVHSQNYQATAPYYGVKVAKLNSNTINMIGFQGEKPKGDYQNFIYNNKLNYLLTKPTGEVIFSNYPIKGDQSIIYKTN